MLKFDYGIADKGVSLERKIFLPALQERFKINGDYQDECVPFWLEDHGFKTDPEGLQLKIMDFITEQKPDVVFTVLMEYEITQATLKWIKAQGIKVINFFCDSTWRWEWVKTIAPCLTHAFDTDYFSISKYEELGCQGIYCQWGWYERFIKPENEPYKYDVSFIGGWNLARQWYVESLLPEVKVECFGQGWPNGRAKLRDVIPYTKINLNLSNSMPTDVRFFQWLQSKRLQMNSGKIGEQIKLRHFEIQGYGAFQLSPYGAYMNKEFDGGLYEMIDFYANIDELKKLTLHYLNLPITDEIYSLHTAIKRNMPNYQLDGDLGTSFADKLFSAFGQAGI